MDIERLLEPGRNCWRVSSAERIAPLVDGAQYFEAFAAAALEARDSIAVVGWDFDSRIRLWRGEPPPGVPLRVGEFFEFLAKRRRGLEIYVLIWDFPMAFALDRDLGPLFSDEWSGGRGIQFCYDGTHPAGACHHQKLTIIDDAMAFVGGFDLTRGRRDTSKHLAKDPLRMDHGVEQAPFHDVVMAVDGPAACDLAELVRERWRRATGREMKAASPGRDPWPAGLEPLIRDATTGIARTLPAYGDQPLVREIEQLYLDTLAAAREDIYIENQYFAAHRIGEAIEKRLREECCPDLVLAIRFMTEGWIEKPVLGDRRDRLIKRLSEVDRRRRFGVYCPRVPGLALDRFNLHAKVCIADRTLLRIGSANLNNRSMGVDTECDLVVEARGDERVREAIGQFRDRLLAEHLGVDTSDVTRAVEREGSLIRAVEALRGGPRTLERLQSIPEWSDGVVDAISMVADPEEPLCLEGLMDRLTPDDDPDPSARDGQVRTHLVTAGVSLLVLGILFATWRWTPLKDLVTPENVREWARELARHGAAPFAIVFAYTPAGFIMFPRPLITLAAVIIYGAWAGFALAMTGVLLATLIGYGAGRLLKRGPKKRPAGRKMNRFIERLRRNQLRATIAVRLIPVAPFPVINIIAGRLRISVWRFLLGTAIGFLPGLAMETVFGSELENALEDPSSFNWLWIVVAVLLFVLGALGLRWFVREDDDDGHPRGRTDTESPQESAEQGRREVSAAVQPRRGVRPAARRRRSRRVPPAPRGH